MKSEEFKNHRFMMVGHSMGGLVTYGAILKDGFPIDRLQTVITLCSPLTPAVQSFNEETNILHRLMIQEYQERKPFYPFPGITHINLHAGTRDTLVSG
jgi:alpha-beta hydrolase superfamily lysophospholipase